jgi:hypothetical protein
MNKGFVTFLFLVVVFWALVILAASCFANEVAIGDSIAAGTGKALGVETHAKVGAGSCAIIALVPGGHYDGAVISAGINDGGGCVGAVRAKVDADVIVWILPAPINPGYAAVRAVARRYGDRTVRYRCAGPCTRSNFHPASYQVVAKWVRIKWTGGRLPVAIFANPPVRNGR